jgi:hypothetical protein
MSLDIKSSGDKIGVSTLKQSDASTVATVDRVLLFNEASLINVAENREHNQEEKTGEVEPTDIDILDRTAEGTLTMDKASPDGLAWAFSMLFDNHAVSTPGGATNAREHIMKMLAYPENPAYWSAIHKKGGSTANSAPAGILQQIGLSINTLRLNLQKNEFMSMEMGVLGLGKYNDGLYTETISAAGDGSADLTLAYDPINDDHTNVDVWCDADEDGVYETHVTTVGYTEATNALDISDPGGPATAINYRVTYPPAADETGYLWVDDLDAVNPATEFKLKAANLQIIISGVYSEPGGVPTFSGGQTAGCEIENMTYEFNWNAEVGRCWREGSVETIFGRAVELGDPLQTITISRRVLDWLLKQHYDANTEFGVHINAVSAADAIEAGFEYEFELFIPHCKILEKPQQVNDGRWADQATLQVLKSGSDPTCIVRVQNEQTAYHV